MPEDLRGFYMYLRQAFGPFAQGPVALVSRHGDECVFSVDALGLRPLWPIETADAFVFSRAGVVAVAETVGEPKPLAPGEKLMVTPRPRAASARRCSTTRPCSGSAAGAGASAPGARRRRLRAGDPGGRAARGPRDPRLHERRAVRAGEGGGPRARRLRLAARRHEARAADGGHRRRADRLARLRRPAGRLSPERQNLADYFKESVAVVTNPAIDREREVEHFSCRAVFGARPGIEACRRGRRARSRPRSRSSSAGTTGSRRCPTGLPRAWRSEHKTFLLEDLWEEFRGRAAVLDISLPRGRDHPRRDRAAEARGHGGP